MRLLPRLTLLCAGTFSFGTLGNAAEPSDVPSGEIVFSKPQGYGNHITIQPRTDYHRVRVFARFRNMSGQQGFARMVYRASGSSDDQLVEGVLCHKVRIKETDPLWVFYFRVPRFPSERATYRIELGEFIPDKPGIIVDGYYTMTAFQYTVDRDDNGNAVFSPKLGKATMHVPIARRHAVVHGGAIDLWAGKPLVEVSLSYGVEGSNQRVPGTGAKRIGGAGDGQ